MARAPEEQAWIDGFAEIYRVAQAPIMRKIERRVCDYGATSYTTRREAEQLTEPMSVARILGLDHKQTQDDYRKA